MSPLHGLPAPELLRQWRLPAEPDSVAEIRHAVAAQCTEWGLAQQACDDLELVTSELVSNAVMHGAGPLLITVRRSTTHVYVGVTDRAPDAPVHAARPDPRDEQGRGLFLVSTVAAAWGWEQQPPSSKLVWATLRT